MNTGEEPLRIIGNESNMVYEIEQGSNADAPKKAPVPEGDEANGQADGSDQTPAATQGTNDLATNDGAIIETLDTAFHGQHGVTEGRFPSGSNRAHFYEERSSGKSDAEEELNSSADQ